MMIGSGSSGSSGGLLLLQASYPVTLAGRHGDVFVATEQPDLDV